MVEVKNNPPKTQIRVTRGQKRMKVLLEFKEALITVARFTENPALDAGYVDLEKQIDLMIAMEGQEQEEQVLSTHKQEPRDRGALDKEMMINMILNAFKRPETLKECLQSVEK